MPSLYTVFGYKIYFWMQEGNEPIHIHVSKGKPTSNATKIWILSNGDVKTENKSRYPKKDIAKIENFVKANAKYIIARWYDIFNYIKYYK